MYIEPDLRNTVGVKGGKYISAVLKNGFQTYVRGIARGRGRHWSSKSFLVIVTINVSFITHAPDSMIIVLNSCAIY
jgi:putative NADPH-quinone reductase